MSFFISMFLCNLLVPLVMIIGGYFMYNRPPEDINSVMGYRTKRSKKNKDTWKFAHEYCGRLWIKVGAILLILTIVVQIPFVHSDSDVIAAFNIILIIVQTAVLIVSLVPVERALERTFDENGNRR